jgi:hypothetical protein
MPRRSGWWSGAVLMVLLLAGAAVAPLLPSREARREPRLPIRKAEQARYYLFEHLQPIRLTNCELRRFGEPHDGGYLMCGNLLDSVDAGYSYGIGGYDGWGCDVSIGLGVRVHQYDCFDPQRPACAGGDVQFHDECVGDQREDVDGRAFDTLANQVANNGDTGRRLVVKMDVEGAEWDSLLAAPDDVLAQIDQLAIEFHGVDDRSVVTVLRLKDFFYVAHLHFNNFACQAGLEPFPSWAYEALFVNKRVGIPDPSGAPAVLPHPLDAPNGPGRPDCQSVN